MLIALGQVSDWVTKQNYEQVAIHTFLQDPDYYLIAHALSKKYTLVTHEIPSNSQKIVKIPDVCMGIGVNFLNTFGMLKREKARFVLERR